MKMIYMSSATWGSIEHVEEKVMDIFEQNGQPLKHGGRLRSGELHLLRFDNTRNTTELEIKIDKAGTHIFFTEHVRRIQLVSATQQFGIGGQAELAS
ncbi:hypothetical protein [Desulfosoma caldarium]|uniref:hypothetical protein n=1 Tax=Desulfosoma caldarium TaxID=610254 RepID=UPI0011CECB38|nr:hypothetical protein [Desulfosoma caldarium]